MKPILTVPANPQGTRIHRVFRLRAGYFVVYLNLLPDGSSDSNTVRQEYTGQGAEKAAKDSALALVNS